MQSRQTVEEDDNEGLLAEEWDDKSKDEYTQNMDEYDDFVHDSLADHDHSNLMFKNILKRDRGFKSLGARDSVLSAG